ncbi:MAG: hybrid sensor histidine kinase/response regulator [Candidatus Xenobia bacterium]
MDTIPQPGLWREERLRALGQMTSGMAHNLSNALSGIVLYTEIAQREDALPPHVRECLNNIQTAAADAGSILARARDFYRGRSASPPKSEMVDLSQVIRDVVQFTRFKWKDEAEAQGVAIDVVTDLPPVRRVRALAGNLREAFTNLLVNGVDALLPNGGRLTVRTFDDGDQVAVSMSDTGHGMTEATLAQAFKPFFSTKGTAGSGLGLSLTADLISRHAGSWEVQTSPGAGTTVIVRLPAHREMVPTPAPPTRQQTEPLHVLCVDDESLVRHGVEGLLRSRGHRVISAGNGREALCLLEHLSFDVLLTDHGMPGMTGLDLARTVRARNPEIRVVLLTGWTDIEGASPDVDLVLRKPPTPEALESALAVVQSSRRR